MYFLIAPLALLIERYFGYPQKLTDAIGHPVMWFGRLIDTLERKSNRADRAPERRRNLGIINLAILLGITLVVTVLVQQFVRAIPGGWIIEALLVTPFLAQKELGRAVGAVANALDVSLDAGRTAVSHIVGRDPQVLDEAGVRAQPLKRWRKARRTGWWRHYSGWFCSGFRALRSTRRSTPLIR
ncbi:MAG TPA: cobalamin biosynthesis protein [Devosia sp.]|nr:cobalamin biosynthesis protein [Devosia sp.]